MKQMSKWMKKENKPQNKISVKKHAFKHLKMELMLLAYEFLWRRIECPLIKLNSVYAWVKTLIVRSLLCVDFITNDDDDDDDYDHWSLTDHGPEEK